MTPEIEENNHSRKINLIRLIFLIVYLLILLLVYYYVVQIGFNPILLIFLISFLFLITIGLFLRKKRGTLYSRIFPDKERKSLLKTHQNNINGNREKDEIKMQMRIPSRINLDVNYRKPLIQKCNGCGNILPSFAKKCPFCGKQTI